MNWYENIKTFSWILYLNAPERLYVRNAFKSLCNSTYILIFNWRLFNMFVFYIFSCSHRFFLEHIACFTLVLRLITQTNKTRFIYKSWTTLTNNTIIISIIIDWPIDLTRYKLVPCQNTPWVCTKKYDKCVITHE